MHLTYNVNRSKYRWNGRRRKDEKEIRNRCQCILIFEKIIITHTRTIKDSRRKISINTIKDISTWLNSKLSVVISSILRSFGLLASQKSYHRLSVPLIISKLKTGKIFSLAVQLNRDRREIRSAHHVLFQHLDRGFPGSSPGRLLVHQE